MSEITPSPDDKSHKEFEETRKGLFNRIREWKRGIARFFVELRQTSIAFWKQPSPEPTKDILLSASSYAVILLARSTHANLGDLLNSTWAFFTIAITAAGLAYTLCLLDSKTRVDYQANANRCYRVLIIGTLIVALFIASNHIVPWAETISYYAGYIEDGFWQRFWTLAFPGATVAFAVVLLNSLFDPAFRAMFRRPDQSADSDRARVGVWCASTFCSYVILAIPMFSYVK